MEQGNKIILVLGIIAITAGIFVKLESASFQDKAVKTEGKVVHVIGSSYHIQYFTTDGTEKIYKGSGKTHGFREGNSVTAWYNPGKPDRVRFSDGKKGARILLFGGIACVLLGIYPLFSRKKESPAA